VQRGEEVEEEAQMTHFHKNMNVGVSGNMKN